jgi:hypothetical protein
MEQPHEKDDSNHNGGFLNLNRVAGYKPERSWRTWLIGRPLPTADAPSQTIGKAVGLAVFGADALSSIAYAPQETLVILAAAHKHWVRLSDFVGHYFYLLVTVSYQQPFMHTPAAAALTRLSRKTWGQPPRWWQAPRS